MRTTTTMRTLVRALASLAIMLPMVGFAQTYFEIDINDTCASPSVPAASCGGTQPSAGMQCCMLPSGAQPPQGVGGAAGMTKYPNPLTLSIGGSAVDTLPKFMLALVDGFILIMAPIIVLFIIYSGFLFVTARGSEQKLASAKTAITWALIGAAVLLGAKALSFVIQGTILGLR